MWRISLRWLLLFCLFSAGAAVLPAAAGERGGSKPPRMAQTGMYGVTVTLKEPQSLRSLDDDDDAYAEANLQLQAKVISVAFGKSPASLEASGRGLQQFTFIPAFSVRASEAEISRLKADRRVKSVTRNILLAPSR